MKVTIDFGPELDSAVQRHLEDGTSVQAYIRGAVTFFNDALKIAADGKHKVGYGDAIRFTQYNTELPPLKYLEDQT